MKTQTLLPFQWQEYKEIRLRALKTEPQAFLSPYEKEAAYPDEKWKQRLETAGKGRSWVFFAKNEEDRLVGIVGAYRDDDDLQNHSAQVWGLYVDRETRGKGIGKALMTKVLGELESDPDIKTIILEVNTDQEIAKKIYEFFGFEVRATYSQKLGDGKEHQISKMEKSLKRSP
jgi:ribosomal protein S18 acetylase RimI-like enzyme